VESVYKVTSFEDLSPSLMKPSAGDDAAGEHRFRRILPLLLSRGDRVRVMPYEPRNPHHLRYIDKPAIDDPN